MPFFFQKRPKNQLSRFMIHIDTSKTIKALKALNSGLSERDTNRAISLAFNATMRKQRTFLSRHIRQKYPSNALKAGGYSGGKGIIIERANVKRLYSVLRISPKPVPLIYYRHRQASRGIEIQVAKRKRHILPFAFYAKGKMKRKHITARGNYAGNSFAPRKKRLRKSGSDLPITQLVGPPVGNPDASAMLKARDNATKEATEQLGKFFDKIAGGILK